MRARGERRRAVLAAAIALLGMSVWGRGNAQGIGGGFSLVIQNLGGRLLLKESVHLGERITFVYNHSVEKVPVIEIHEVRGEGPLYLVELISRDPLLSYPGYERYRIQPWDGKVEGPLPEGLDRSTRDWFVVRGFDRAKEMPLAVGSVARNQRILIGRKVIALRDIARPGEIIKLSVRRK